MSVARRLNPCRMTSLVALACLAFGTAPAQSPSIPTSIVLSRVEFVGLKRYTPEQILAAADLRRGQTITDIEMKDISNRLLRTGLFRKVSNRYLITGNEMDITFTIEEADWNVPVHFDNFVWFSEPELTAAIAARVPTFEGKAPETGGVLTRIAEALQSLLAERKLAGRVANRPSFSSDGSAMTHVFKVEGVQIPICRFVFPGSEVERTRDLLDRAKVLVGENYSRGQIERFAQMTLLPVYLETGRLRSRFAEHQVSVDTAADCRGGVSITLPVAEGEVCLWDGARWSGNKEFTVEDLDAMLGMKRGEPARAQRIQEGLDAVRGAYTARGFLKVRLDGSPVFPSDEPRAVWGIAIDEGPGYSMGALVISGLPENLAERARKQWRLEAGARFDATYPNRFFKEVLARIAPPGGSARTSLKLDNERLLVNVTIEVTGGAPARP